MLARKYDEYAWELEEVEENPRARSARLRFAEKC